MKCVEKDVEEAWRDMHFWVSSIKVQVVATAFI
jgi:hypothetical protein